MNSLIEGKKSFGEAITLLQQGDDLTANTHWKHEGYHIDAFFSRERYASFYEGVHSLFQKFLRNIGIQIHDKAPLSDYHLYIKNKYDLHLAVVDQAKLLQIEEFPVSIQRLEERISELCGIPVQALNPYNGDKVFHFRIIRPQSKDNNPLHRDVWLEEYKDCINIYVPICGSNHFSSLSLVPGSHYWSEAMVEKTIGGAKVNGIQFNVPAVTDSKIPLNIIRPNPGLNQVLIFSPYLLHGGATNLNVNKTRISLEMRFWRKNPNIV
ncbi:hypothetical protein OKW21_006176 [Catalinimonas alkaloidigena]|uniref:hypothetical protein n=1 Tax=Catalinimonas alkaloidigena TaxID=1075417 RepID=UPI002405B9C0|nr:hypothetical protein [Catalinimonas alkaloidigena]MDF9800913.1 hypothetical protein [Catalinimonas alkaloidigena]